MTRWLALMRSPNGSLSLCAAVDTGAGGRTAAIAGAGFAGAIATIGFGAMTLAGCASGSAGRGRGNGCAGAGAAIDISTGIAPNIGEGCWPGCRNIALPTLAV